MSETPSKTHFVATVIAALGLVAIFVLIVTIAYRANPAKELPQGAKTDAQREEIYAKRVQADREATAAHAWIDQSKGVVRLPVDRAAELTIQEYNRKK